MVGQVHQKSVREVCVHIIGVIDKQIYYRQCGNR